jgi:two-component system CheB/CheR fusion protein
VTGQHFLNLDIGLPLEQLRPLLRGALAGETGEAAVDAVNRRGRAVSVRVVSTPLSGRSNGAGGDGAIIVMEADD